MNIVLHLIMTLSIVQKIKLKCKIQLKIFKLTLVPCKLDNFILLRIPRRHCVPSNQLFSSNTPYIIQAFDNLFCVVKEGEHSR